ncbi:MAG: 3'-5' exonuclease [Candidatus Acidiferrales bacterium]
MAVLMARSREGSQGPSAAIRRTLKLNHPLAVIDLETTGTWTDHDRIVEVAVLKVYPYGRRTKYHTRVNPKIPIPEEATAIHGISDADVRDAPSFKRIAKKVIKSLDGCDLAGFNLIRFDLRMLKSEFARVGIDFSIEGRRVVDACRIFHLKEPRDLSAAYRFFCGLEHDGAHSALEDARATWRILQAQIARYDDLPTDLESLHELCTSLDDRFVDAGEKFVWRNNEAVVGFGKHQGTSLKVLAKSAPDYLEWMIENDFHPETKKIARNALKGKFPKRPSKR